MKEFATGCTLVLCVLALVACDAAGPSKGPTPQAIEQLVVAARQPTPVSAPTPVPTPSTISPPKHTREQILASRQAGTPAYPRLDRKEAKLVMLDELETWLASLGDSSSGPYPPGTGPGSIVWAVVVAGEIVPDRGMWMRDRYPRWEVKWYNAGTGAFMGAFWAGNQGDWPPDWEALPDRDPGRR